MRRAILSAQRTHPLQRRAAATPGLLQAGVAPSAATSASASSSSSSHHRQLHQRASTSSSRDVYSTSASIIALSAYRSVSSPRFATPPRRSYATESKQPQQQGSKKTGKENKKAAELEADAAAKDAKNKKDNSDDGEFKSPIPGLESFFGGKLGQRGSQDTPSNSPGSGKAQKGAGFPFGLGEESAKDSEAEHLNKSSSDGKGNSSNGGSSGSPGPPQGLAPYLIPLGVLVLFHFITNSDSSSREITWQEFRTAFLDKGLVDKLTVVNRSKVRVHLHSNATGVLYPQSPAADGRSTYYFSIGSVEAFERKLDEAQGELGIPSTERVPVAYKDETSVGSTLLSFAPTFLIVGVLYFLSRRAGGGAGAGGPGGIFGVGKSKAKMFNVSSIAVNTFIHSTNCFILRTCRKIPMSRSASKM